MNISRTLSGIRYLFVIFAAVFATSTICAETQTAPLPEEEKAEEAAANASTEQPPPPEQTQQQTTQQPNLVGPTGATGVIRRSDRRQDRRAGDPRID